MKIILISDIHYACDRAENVISRHPDAEYVLFLGDGESAFLQLREHFPKIGFLGVAGNCDYVFNFADLPDERTVNLDGVKIYMTHGHKVGTTDSSLGWKASWFDADIALFGHTHVPHLGEYISEKGKTVTVFNPGSIGNPRGGSCASYGILQIKEGIFNLKHYEY